MAFHSIFERNLFAGQVVLVTGGGTGIGHCTAFELALLGAMAVVAGRRAEKLQETSAEIKAAWGKADWIQCDIREEDAVRAMIAAVLERHGRLDGLVNNAGGQFRSPLEELSKTRGRP
jgi:citronellol/citronellal dehydrogenase